MKVNNKQTKNRIILFVMLAMLAFSVSNSMPVAWNTSKNPHQSALQVRDIVNDSDFTSVDFGSSPWSLGTSGILEAGDVVVINDMDDQLMYQIHDDAVGEDLNEQLNVYQILPQYYTQPGQDQDFTIYIMYHIISTAGSGAAVETTDVDFDIHLAGRSWHIADYSISATDQPLYEDVTNIESHMVSIPSSEAATNNYETDYLLEVITTSNSLAFDKYCRVFIDYVRVEINCDTVPITVPDAPTLSLPVDHRETNDNTPWLAWDSVSGAVLYEVQIDDSATFASPAQDETTSNSYYTALTLPDGTYYWRVRAQNSQSFWGDWSVYRTLYIDATAPGIPTLAIPGDMIYTNDTTPFFDWTSVPETDIYKLHIADNLGFVPVIENPGIAASEFTVLNPLPEGELYWRVRGEDTAGNVGDWSEVRTITIDETPPDAPILSDPDDGELIDDDTPRLNWVDDEEIIEYRVQVDTDGGFSSPLIDDTTSNSEYFITAPLAEGTYYWKCVGYDRAMNIGWQSDTWSFEIDITPPDQPTLEYPTNNSVVTDMYFNIEWADTTGADYYQLWVGRDDQFTSNIVDTTVTVSNYTFPWKINDEYFWQVRGIDNAGNVGIWSETRNFTLAIPAPDPPVLLSPANETIFDVNHVNFTWDTPADAVGYRFQLDYYDDFDMPITTDFVDNPGHWKESLANGVYYWRVAAKNSDSVYGDWSVTRVFTVAVMGQVLPAPPVISTPNQTKYISEPLELSWTPVNSVDRYDLYINGSKIDSTAVTTFDLTFNTTGIHDLTLTSVNQSGESAHSAVVRITVLPDPILLPSILVISPDEGGIVDRHLNVPLVVEIIGDFIAFEYYLESVLWWHEWEVNTSIDILGLGEDSIIVKAIETQEGEIYSQPRSFTVDVPYISTTEPPILIHIESDATSFIAGQSYTFQITVENKGAVDIEGIHVEFYENESFTINDDFIRYINTIKAGESSMPAVLTIQVHKDMEFALVRGYFYSNEYAGPFNYPLYPGSQTVPLISFNIEFGLISASLALVYIFILNQKKSTRVSGGM